MSKFITTLLFVFLAASVIKAQETIEVGLQPTAIIYDEAQQGFHVFCFGYDEDFDGEKLSDSEESPSWWFITNHLDVWTAEKKMEFDFLSFKFPFRPAVIWNETTPTIYIPQKDTIKSFNLNTFEVIDDNFLPVDANAVDAADDAHLLVTRNNYFDIADVLVYQISSKEKLQDISTINNPTMALYYKTSENKKGMAILNEGGWGENNSVLQLGYINHKSEFELDTLHIGDLGNHIYYTPEYPDNMIVTVNGSDRVLVIDLINNEVERTIQMDALTAPRESFLWDDKIWTTTYSDDIIVSDFNTGEIIKKNKTDSYTEGMALGMGMVAVSNVSNTDYTPNNVVQLFPISVTGIEALAKNNQDAILYPNPANNIVNIELKNNENIEQIELLDISGNLLLKYSNISSKSGNSIQLDEVSSGTYFVRITGAGNEYLKILKVTK